MLTSNNQYLRPEYLTPLPTTLDAKKSPLALLAQTCSQIGADAPNSKLLQSSEKASTKPNKPDCQKDKPDNPNKSAPKPELPSPREKSRTPEERSNSASNGSRVRSPPNPKPPPSSRCSSNRSTSSPSSYERKTPNGERTATPDRHTPSKTAFTPNILTSSSDPAFKDLPLGTFKPGVPPTTTTSYLGYPAHSYPHPMDLLGPYYAYGRMKPPDTLSSTCRDPYCAQCDHAKTPYAHAYAHAHLAALALPYVCNWVSGDASYCGKRFPSSDELLQHLRTHPSGSLMAEAHPLLHRSYPTTPRYHPYGKAGGLLPPSMGASSLAGFALGHPGLAPYLTPYSLYGPRLGAAPGMHP